MLSLQYVRSVRILQCIVQGKHISDEPGLSNVPAVVEALECIICSGQLELDTTGTMLSGMAFPWVRNELSNFTTTVLAEFPGIGSGAPGELKVAECKSVLPQPSACAL